VVTAGEQRGARRGADGGARIEIGEADAAGGEAVEGGSLYRAAIAAEVAETEVVGEKDDDVGARGGRFVGGVGGDFGKRKEQRKREGEKGGMREGEKERDGNEGRRGWKVEGGTEGGTERMEA
jgi:hypothetical protein